MASKREIETVRDELAQWCGRWARTDGDYRLVAAVVSGLNAAARHPPCPHPAVLAQLVEDVARLESACRSSVECGR